MTIKPVLVPDHDAVSLRALMDHFAEASTGPTRQQLAESRAAVAAAQGVAEQQVDELSVHKMLKYSDAAEKDRDALNQKWDDRTASEKEKERVLRHEKGEQRAADKIKQKTGKLPVQIGKLDRLKHAITREGVAEGFMDTVKQAFNDCVVGYPQGTSEGQFIQGWARAIRAETGRDIPLEKLTQLYQDYVERSDELMQSHGTTNEEQGVTETISPASQARNAAARDYETDLLNKDNEQKQTWWQKTIDFANKTGFQIKTNPSRTKAIFINKQLGFGLQAMVKNTRDDGLTIRYGDLDGKDNFNTDLDPDEFYDEFVRLYKDAKAGRVDQGHKFPTQNQFDPEEPEQKYLRSFLKQDMVEAGRPDVMRHAGDKTIKVVKRGGRPIGEI